MAWDWRSSYLEQAKSDHAMFSLIRNQAPLCQSLHYLQMATEKMAKGFLTRPHGPRYGRTHDAFVRFMRASKTRPEFQTASRFTRSSQFVAYVDSLLDIVQRIEDLSRDGEDHPSPEYPWEVNEVIVIPLEHPFTELALDGPKMVKLLQFTDDCFTVA